MFEVMFPLGNSPFVVRHKCNAAGSPKEFAIYVPSADVKYVFDDMLTEALSDDYSKISFAIAYLNFEYELEESLYAKDAR